MVSLSEFGLQAKKRFADGRFDHVPDELFASAYLDRHPDLWDIVSPAAREIKKLMKREHVPSYMFPMFVSSRREAQDTADMSAATAREATDLHLMELSMKAAEAGMTVEHFSLVQGERVRAQLTILVGRFQAELEHFRNNESIRLNRAALAVQISKDRADEHLRVAKARHDADLKLEYAWKLHQLERKIHGRRKSVRRPSVQEADEPEVGGVDTDSIP